MPAAEGGVQHVVQPNECIAAGNPTHTECGFTCDNRSARVSGALVQRGKTKRTADLWTELHKIPHNIAGQPDRWIHYILHGRPVMRGSWRCPAHFCGPATWAQIR